MLNNRSPTSVSIPKDATSGHQLALTNYANGDILFVVMDGYGWASSQTLFGGGVTQLAITSEISGNWKVRMAIVQVTNNTVAMNVSATHGFIYACKVE